MLISKYNIKSQTGNLIKTSKLQPPQTRITYKFLYYCSKIQKFKKSKFNSINNTRFIIAKHDAKTQEHKFYKHLINQLTETTYVSKQRNVTKKRINNLKLTFTALSASDVMNGIDMVEKYLNNFSYFFIKSVRVNEHYNKTDLHYLANLKSIYIAAKNCYTNVNLNDADDTRIIFYLAEHISSKALLEHYQKPPQKTKLLTVIRSAFIFKKTREQFGLTKINYFTSINVSSKVHQQLLLQIINLLKLPCELKIQINN